MRELPPELEEKLKKLPDRPGVYMHLNENGEIIYVGKAKNLKHRVKQYFRNNLTDIKTQKLVENIRMTNWIVTDNEVEALLLECNLIKEHRPYYNILLKDDKSYPYIKLTAYEPFPKLEITRKRLLDGGKYFGPYTNSLSAKKTIEAINRFYPLKMCSKKLEPGLRTGNVCLNFHIHQCCAPCQGNISQDEYKKYTDEVVKILSGDYKILLEKINKQMYDEAEKLNFETAAYLKELAGCVADLYEKQKVDNSDMNERDIIASAGDGRLACIQIFYVREGKIIKSDTRYMTKAETDSDADSLSSFIQQYYTSGIYIPREIILSEEIAEEESLSQLLSELRGAKTTVSSPKIGDKKRLCELARQNAVMNIENRRSLAERAVLAQHNALNEIAQAVGMKKPISRIESYDISNIAGTDNVGAMVVFTNGKKEPENYRRFRIKYVSGQDDYASMSEVVFRRLQHAYTEMQENTPNPKFLPLPELILADGGLTHVNAVRSIIKDFGFDIAVAGLVKDSKHKLRGLMLEDGTEIKQSNFKYAKKLLNDISEEVHRFAIEYHRASRSKSMLKSELEDIQGIGPKRVAALMRSLKTIDKIKTASVEELASADGMNLKAAEAVYEYFNGGSKKNV